ncbi:hypothetical protein MN032_15700 [Agromyces atrinae]|uniref:hypothetical protein n=1 Tax=Agromyces atrinae TaxID=592376 RepID=UPI001F55FC88|nr:hypothetical protein [Agromyces atrinae]MCI2959135.1 hypothetical protein [Agromyces atrinae]
MKVDRPHEGAFSVHRQKLKCKWEDVERYLAERPEFDDSPSTRAEEPPAEPTALELYNLSQETYRRILRHELELALQAPKLAYTYRQAAEAVGISEGLLRGQVREGWLNPVYIASKPIFTVDELKRWLASLPGHPD